MHRAISWLILELVFALMQEHVSACPEKCLCDADLKAVYCKGVLDSELKSLLQNSRYSWALSFENSDIRYLKNHTFDDQAQLRELAVVRSSLYGVEESTFKHLNNLVKLNLSSNRIEIIGTPASFLDRRFNSAVAYLPNFVTAKLLRYVDLSNNNIKFISAEELYGLKFVQSVDLSRNNIQKVDFYFRYLMGVKRLDLSFNRITSIDQKFGELQMILQELHLSHNYIAELPNFNRLSCSKLQLLNVGYNMVTSVKALNTEECSELTMLELNGNKISFIHVDDFESYKKLENLNIADNMIKEIAGYAFSSNSLLVTLLASRNRIVSISANTLKGLNAITSLDLDQNKISTIAEDAFFDNVWLQYISLQDNHVRFLLPKTFINLSLLKVVNLKNNLLTMQEPEWFLSVSGEFYYDAARGEVMEKIRGSFGTFLLSGNPWNCDCEAIHFYEWAITQKYVNTSILPATECASPVFHKLKHLLTMQKSELTCDMLPVAISYFIYYMKYFIILSFALLIVLGFCRKCRAKKQYHVM